MAQQLTKPEEKVRYYRQAAIEAEHSSRRAIDPDTKQAYLAIMRTWTYLADELEREIEMGIAVDETPMSEQADEIAKPRSDGAESRKSH